jgi:four helix bundle protein
MIARRFEDLIVWQLADKLQQEVFAFTAKPPACRDYKYCDQIRDASRSASWNTSEGFGRYYPKEFRHFLRIAAASLHEVKNQLLDGRDLGYLTDEEHVRLKRLALRAIKANVRLSAYLHHAKAPEPFWRAKKPKEPREPREPREP